MSAQHAPPPNLGMQVTTFENPMGIDGFEFVEFAAPPGQGELLHDYFRKHGLHRGAAAQDAADHRVPPGRRQLPGQRGSGFASPPTSPTRTAPAPAASRSASSKPAGEVLQTVLGNGGEAIDRQGRQQGGRRAGGQGHRRLHAVPGRPLWRQRHRCTRTSCRCRAPSQNPKGFGLTFIDHLTHNLYFGNMQKWSDYYERLFNFREIRYFDIKGAKTGLVSKAMTAPDGVVRIPLNESQRPEVADQRIPRRLQGRGHPAHRLLHRRHLRDGRGDARGRASSSSTRPTPTST